MIWKAVHPQIPLLAEAKHPPVGGRPGWDLPPCCSCQVVPSGLTRSTHFSSCSVGTGQESHWCRAGRWATWPKCQAVLCLTASCRLHLQSHSSGLQPPLELGQMLCISSGESSPRIKAAFRLWTRMVQLRRISNFHTLSSEQTKSCNSAGSVLSSLGNSQCYRKVKCPVIFVQ